MYIHVHVKEADSETNPVLFNWCSCSYCTYTAFLESFLQGDMYVSVVVATQNTSVYNGSTHVHLYAVYVVVLFTLK